MTLVNSKEDIEAIRPYKSYKLLVEPKTYPAFVEFEHHEGGIGGGYYTMNLVEIPKEPSFNASFLAGFCAGMHKPSPKPMAKANSLEKSSNPKTSMKQTLKYQFPDGSKIPVQIHNKDAAKVGWSHGTVFQKSVSTESIRIEWTTKNNVRHAAWLPASGLTF